VVPQPIYSDKDVKITDHFATIFGVSYPVRAISSLKTRRKGMWLFFLIIIGSVLLFYGLFAFSVVALPEKISTPSEFLSRFPERLLKFLASPFPVFVVIGIALLIAAGKINPGFKLILVTNAQERAVITSKDPAYIQRVRAAIEQAIIGAGQAVTGRDRTGTVMGVTPQFGKTVPELSNKNRYPREA
jgi:hypothetical protein